MEVIQGLSVSPPGPRRWHLGFKSASAVLQGLETGKVPEGPPGTLWEAVGHQLGKGNPSEHAHSKLTCPHELSSSSGSP